MSGFLYSRNTPGLHVFQAVDNVIAFWA